jgi:hypothetical protein
MRLAGFHLMTKTPSAPQWIWSTFEQVDPGKTASRPEETVCPAGARKVVTAYFNTIGRALRSFWVMGLTSKISSRVRSRS